MGNEKINLEKFDKLILERKATWWQMNLPSGDVIFGDAKTEMLGYPSDNFKKYQDFTDLLEPKDNEIAMQAMRDHLEGKKDFYEVVYKIKRKDGQYIKFYDCGQIVEKDGENISVMGFVININENQKIEEQIDDFKKMIISGNPSMIDLVKKIKTI